MLNADPTPRVTGHHPSAIPSTQPLSISFHPTASARYLPDAVNELKEDWRSVRIGMFVLAMSNTLGEFVTECQPFLLDQYLESAHGSAE